MSTEKLSVVSLM